MAIEGNRLNRAKKASIPIGGKRRKNDVSDQTTTQYKLYTLLNANKDIILR